MAIEPVNLTPALESFTEVYSPRIVARIDIAIRDADGVERTVACAPVTPT